MRTIRQAIAENLDRRRVDSHSAHALAYALRGLESSGQARRDSRVLRASGARIFTMRPERMRALAGNAQQWQPIAWQYRDGIGELRFALKYRAQAISKISLHVAENVPGEDEPLPISLRGEVDDQGKPTERSEKITTPPDLCAAAERELARLPLEDGYGFLGIWSENQDVAGECWLHGYPDPDTGDETWKIRSVLEVGVQGSQMTVKDELGQPRIINLGTKDKPGTEEIYRLWVPHPAHGHLADSALKAMLDVLEDITLYGREMRAVSRSRIANNGVWMIPENMATLRNLLRDTEAAEDGPSSFMAALQAAFLAPISNEGEPGGVVPAIITGSREDIETASKSFIRFERETSADIIEKLRTALGRMGSSLDLPPEIITGMAEANHWTGWLIDASSFRYHLEPSVRLQADSLTGPFLRSNLIEQGFPPEQVRKLRIWFEAGNLTENPNRRQDALDALDRILIGPAAGRKALGFSEGDAPTAEEALRLIAAKAGIDQATAIALLANFAKQQGTDLPQIALPTQATATRVDQEPQGQGDTGPDAPGSTPSGAPAGITAAAPPPRYRLDTDTAQRLMQIEQALRLELLSIADAATARALERAGSRLRAKATRRPEVAANLSDVAVTSWAATLGREQTFALGADARFLLSEAWATLKEAFYRKVTRTVGDITARLSARLLGGRLGQAGASERMSAEMLSRVDDAWSRLEAALTANAERLMFGDGEIDSVGELPDLSVPPALMRTALAEIGGLPETSAGQEFSAEPVGGLSTGATVTRELDAAGILPVGYLWVYGVTPLAREFPPHRDLEGERFTGWTDPKLTPDVRYKFVGDFYHPGDHRGCFIGDTVVSGPGAHASYVRQYTGPGVKVVTANGHQFTATPNHPVLTPTGWVAAGKLQVGDEVISQVNRERVLAAAPQDHQMPALIEDVARTLPMVGDSVRVEVPVSGPDFHGDGAGSQVCVVRADRGLLPDLDTVIPQPVGQRTLLGADVQSPDLALPSTPRQFDGAVSDGQPEPFELLHDRSTAVSEGSSHRGTALLGGMQIGQPAVQGAVPVVPLATARTHGDALLSQYAEDGLGAYPEPASDSLNAHAGLVQADRVVCVEVLDLDCHVYNLATSDGWYVANGIIVHNCLCDYVPSYAVPEYAGQIAERLRVPTKPTQWLLDLAGKDDAAGRRGTTAQEARDQWQAIQDLQARFMNGA